MNSLKEVRPPTDAAPKFETNNAATPRPKMNRNMNIASAEKIEN